MAKSKPKPPRPLTATEKFVLRRLKEQGREDCIGGRLRAAMPYWKIPTTVPVMNRLRKRGLIEPVSGNGVWWRLKEVSDGEK